jgi:hypothetical protein
MRHERMVGRSNFAPTRLIRPVAAQLLPSGGMADYPREIRLQYLERRGDQRVGPVLNISGAVEQLDIGGVSLWLRNTPCRPKSISGMKDSTPSRSFLLELIGEYAISMIAQDRDVRQLPYRQCERLAAAENGIAGQQDYRRCKLDVTLRSNVPSLQRCKRILARADFRPSVERHSPAVTKPIDDGEGGAVVPAGVVADIDDEAQQIREVEGDLVQISCQRALLDALQVEDPHTANGL